MKNIIMSVVAACAVFTGVMSFSGCDKLPSEEKIYTLAKSVGFAAGECVDLAQTSAEDRNAILAVLDVIDDVVPQTNQTFEAAWKPLIDTTVDKLVAEGKIRDAKAGLIIKEALYVATKGLDYMFEVRWPAAKQYQNLVSAGVRGFTEGFKTVIKPSNVMAAAKFEYDEDEFNAAKTWLKANAKK